MKDLTQGSSSVRYRINDPADGPMMLMAVSDGTQDRSYLGLYVNPTSNQLGFDAPGNALFSGKTLDLSRYGKSIADTSLSLIHIYRRFKTPGQPDADFISCVAWNKVADLMAQYLHKGSLVGVEGRIQTRNYDDANGRRVYVTEVVAESCLLYTSRCV